ncbi:hypothetical protein [Marinibacterium profundimaris]|uniref:Histidinol phosphate aminotransferase n=1 Tax=Marinibacterium profundimaris TaxID=1679460 RepID=A0A225NFZ2_9RHOB|nr:hypothetical protein [Marinibacterium profundimaris]OWU72459.1 hypothetical protein ATO3_15325 [Marinibacterium profundimaris]
MPSDSRPPAPDYANATIIMLGVNLVCMFWVIWSAWGFAAVLLLALALNHGIDRIATARGAPMRESDD